MARNADTAVATRARGWRRVLRWILVAVSAYLLASAVLVLVLRWVPPPTSAFMLARKLDAMAEGRSDFRIDYRWRAYDQVSEALPIALVAAEDQRFPHHRGFDWEAIETAWRRNRAGHRVHGASTISQQTAKNLFLWSGRSWLRKGMEVHFTVLIEALWSKQRILEVYLNVAEFGDGVYGAEAASMRYFRKPAARLDARESALMAAVLPSPRTMSVAQPSPYVRRTASWVERQVRQLGGAAYLHSPAPGPERTPRANRRRKD